MKGSNKRTVQVLETKSLDLLSQTQSKCSGAEAIDSHPCVSSIERGDTAVSLGGGRRRCQGMLNICPSGNNGAEHHEPKRKQGHSRNTAATKPEHLSVGGDNDGHVLEYSVDRDGEVLEGL